MEVLYMRMGYYAWGLYDMSMGNGNVNIGNGLEWNGAIKWM